VRKDRVIVRHVIWTIGAGALLAVSACGGTSNQNGGTSTTTGAGGGGSGGGGGEGGGRVVSTAEMVFMSPSGEVAVMNLDGSGNRELTSDGKQKFLPHFSPDGTRVVYTKFTVGGYGVPDSKSDIAIYDFTTEAETLITDTGGASQAAFSPDGQRLVYGSSTLTTASDGGRGVYVMDLDGSGSERIGGPSGKDDDQVWGDLAWSSDDWILFVVAQTIDGCFKTRLDKMRPDGTARTKVTDGGPSCTPQGFEQSGDADPGFSADGKTIYSSRGFPTEPANAPPPTGPLTLTERKLYAFSSEAWSAEKVEQDLSLPSQPDCIEGVPKGSPDGKRVLLFRMCFGDAGPAKGICVTDTAGSYRTRITDGFGPDWNPVAR